MVLYVFITHKGNIDNCYNRISEMMVNDFVVVKGGEINGYDEKTKILDIQCNDGYSGLPEKAIKAFKYLMEDKRFDRYSHFCKLDDDMILVKRFDSIEGDYLGNVQSDEGNRSWHIGRCEGEWNKRVYDGVFRPWCKGGYGYVVSRYALNGITSDDTFNNNIYEDVYIGILLHKIGVFPENIKINDYVISPDHRK